MKFKIAAIAAATCLTLACVPALAGCSSDTYVGYTLYDEQDKAVRVDKFSENPYEDEEQSGDENSQTEGESAQEGYYYTVTSYGGNPVDVVIPSQINGIPVTGIGVQALSMCRTLKTVVIEEGVTDCEGAAFAFCNALKSVSLPSTLTMGYSMFAQCPNLESVTIAEGATVIADRAFYNCSKLAGINATQDASVNFPSTLEKIDFSAFEGCSSLKGEVVLPEGITAVSTRAFAACSSITKVVLGGAVTKIGYAAFTGCSSLEDINLPEGLTYIGEGAFAYSKLTTVELPQSIEYIGAEAFANSSLENLYAPEGKGCYLYVTELPTDDPETEDKDESVAAGSDKAKDYLFNYYYDEADKGQEDAEGYLPSFELAKSDKAADYITGDCVSAYWYFVKA